MNQEKEELVISFVQQIPEIGEDGKTNNIKVEEVANLVMGKVTAQNLLNGLIEMLSDDDEKGK